MAKYIDVEEFQKLLNLFVEGAKDTANKMVKVEDVAPVIHARWIGTEYDGYADGYPVYDTYECSNCHEEHYGEVDTLTNYCPHCGAKMDLEETK